MKLKEKICEPFGGLTTETVNQLEQIADDFAIGFAEWYRVKCILSSLDYHLTTKELLEIYKKDYENKTV